MSNYEDQEKIGGTEPAYDDVSPGRSVFEDSNPSFENDDDVVPHWSAPPTGSIPQVGSMGQGEMYGTQSPFSTPPIDQDYLQGYSQYESQPYEPTWRDDAHQQPHPQQSISIDDNADAFFSHDDRDPQQFSHEPQPSLSEAFGVANAQGRSLVTATIVGIGLAGLIFAAMALSEWVAVGIITIALGIAAVEYFSAVRAAGLQPAVLLGLVSIVAMPLAVYWRGESAAGAILLLSLFFGAVWYLIVAPNETPVRALSTTVRGILHIGLLGSYAALILSIPTYGTGLLTAAIALTICSDTGALVIGRLVGRTPLSAMSPNKTLEGLVGGFAATIAAAVVMGFLEMPSPMADTSVGGGLTDIVILGVVVAIVAPIGDLVESRLKRGLGIKDMGAILPSHGGIFDRIDSLLFVLPATYYAFQILLP